MMSLVRCVSPFCCLITVFICLQLGVLTNLSAAPPQQSVLVSGLKEALDVGIKNAVAITSKENGFWDNTFIRIPFPDDAIAVKKMALKIGLKSEVDQFELTLNRAAETAVKQALPIFKKAILNLTIQDGLALLQGGDHAITNYLESKTKDTLIDTFKPDVQKAIDKVHLTQYWNPLVTKYNALQGFFGKKINPDLNAYVTEKAVAGLFYMIAKEETKIRQNPKARVSSLLKNVFSRLN